MSLKDFFAPLKAGSFTPKPGFLTSQMGSKVDVFIDAFPDLENGNVDLALFGVLDGRNSVNNEGCALGPDYFRAQFYLLNEGAFESRLVDLGNVIAGKTVADTYIAVKTIVAELVKNDIVPVIIGGGQDLTYAQYLGYEGLEQKVDLVIVDNQFDISEDGDEGIETRSDCYLNKVLLHQPNYLFNFSNIGYQTYFVNQESLSVMEKLYFDAHRLGDFSQNIALAEPIIRNANLISFDIGAIRSADAVGNANATPNGFDGEKACRIARYAGINDKLTSIGFYEFNPAYDNNGQTALLLAQMVWYFIDGFYARKKDFPLTPKSQFIIYRTSLKDAIGEMVFVKSKKSDRWWMQVPYPPGPTKNERYHLMPCKYDDYQQAINGEMPDLWWRTYQKLS